MDKIAAAVTFCVAIGLGVVGWLMLPHLWYVALLLWFSAGLAIYAAIEILTS